MKAQKALKRLKNNSDYLFISGWNEGLRPCLQGHGFLWFSIHTHSDNQCSKRYSMKLQALSNAVIKLMIFFNWQTSLFFLDCSWNKSRHCSCAHKCCFLKGPFQLLQLPVPFYFWQTAFPLCLLSEWKNFCNILSLGIDRCANYSWAMHYAQGAVRLKKE